MRPFFVPGCEVLHTRRTFNGFIVEPKTCVRHGFALLHEQATKCVFRHGVYSALRFPIILVIPLGRCARTHQLPSEHLKQHPISETTAIKNPCALAGRKPLAPRADPGIKPLASRLDCGVICALAVVICPPVSRGTVFAPCAENIRPTNAQKRNLPRNQGKIFAGLLQRFDLACNIFRTIHK